MGGLVAATAVARNPASWRGSGVILLAPSIDVPMTRVKRALMPLGRLVALLAPDARLISAVSDGANVMLRLLQLRYATFITLCHVYYVMRRLLRYARPCYILEDMRVA